MNVQMELSRVLITELASEQVIYLKEKDGERTFPIMIGISEALAINRRLKGEQAARPMTHDLLANVIEAMGGQLERVVINDLRTLAGDNHQTFIATLHVHRDHEVITIDSRPSDAIALGIASDTPIFVAEKVLKEVLKRPETAEDRIELLRRRVEFLKEKIADLTAMLTDAESLAGLPPSTIGQYRRQLSDMQREHDAIERVLRKLG